METSVPVETKRCPICGGPMRPEPFGTVVEEHHLEGPLTGVEFPVIAHPRGWKCQNSQCEHFEPA